MAVVHFLIFTSRWHLLITTICSYIYRTYRLICELTKEFPHHALRSSTYLIGVQIYLPSRTTRGPRRMSLHQTPLSYVKVFCSGKFWYLGVCCHLLCCHVSADFLDTRRVCRRPPEPADLVGKGPFRRIQVLIDGRIAGPI